MQGQLKSREREEKEKRRDGEIQGAKANLKHKGQMLMYNAADCSFYEINANLERDKGKRKATTANEEEDSEDEGSVGQKNLSNEDKDDRGNGKKLRQESPFDIEENKGMAWVRIEIIRLLTGFRCIICDNHIRRLLPRSCFLN